MPFEKKITGAMCVSVIVSFSDLYANIKTEANAADKFVALYSH